MINPFYKTPLMMILLLKKKLKVYDLKDIIDKITKKIIDIKKI